MTDPATTKTVKALEALYALGLSYGAVTRLREIAKREWDNDLKALCAYVLTDYVPADEMWRQRAEGAEASETASLPKRHSKPPRVYESDRIGTDKSDRGPPLWWQLWKLLKTGYDKSERRAVAAEQRANQLADALRAYDDWASRMPDAGFNDRSPRWDWWHERPYAVARAALDRHTPEYREDDLHDRECAR